jgi:cell cycle arrest protein BUB3
VHFGAKTNRLLAASWDRKVYLYDTDVNPRGVLLRSFEHAAPVLEASFGADDSEAFSAGLDHKVKRYLTFLEMQ